MGRWSRRTLLKSSLSLPVSAALANSATLSYAAALAEGAPSPETSSPRERLLLDFGWRFHFGHGADASKDFGFSNGRGREFQKTGNFLPPAALAYDDSAWTPLNLPHDWVIGLPFKNDPALASKGSYPLGRSYPESSVGWYRRTFLLEKDDASKRISLEFDGAYREALVVVNGYYIGQHRGGYDPFRFDITDFIKPGEPNVLLVRVDATQSDGWFYEGAGIYRHVWLVKTAPVHMRQWGTFVTAKVTGDKAALAIRTEVQNHAKAQPVRVTSTVFDPAGKQVARVTSPAMNIEEDGEVHFEQQAFVTRPALWSLEQRNLYRLVTEVHASSTLTDRYETTFGIRTLHFDADKGFFLNGKSVKVKGTCNHQDHAGLGVALPDAAQDFRVKTLIDMGCNGYRASHNPPTSELLDSCDRQGLLFLDETRMMSSNDEGLAQFENLIRRDRNHPCVFLWNMGNEERESTTETGLHILTTMKKAAYRLDGSRPVTVAPPPLGMGLGQGGLNVSDVMGYNYADPQIEAYHKAHPGIPCLGTENVSAVATRGVYKIDQAKGFVSSYDPYTTTGRASAEGWWRFCTEREWMPGGFVWTGFDYRGEPSPYQWPNINSQYGVMDTCGFPKDTYFYYQSWWTQKPVLHVFPHWNWPGLEGKQIAVWVHSNMDRVELLQDGKSLGVKDVPKDSHLSWIVTYAPGILEARGFKNGKQVMTTTRTTTGKAAKIVLRADRTKLKADGEDLAFLTAEVQDAEGRVVPITDNLITFRVTGSAKLIGVGNGDPTSHESDIGSSRTAFSGLCMGIVQTSKQQGSIEIEATSPGLASAKIALTSEPATLRAQLDPWERTVPTGSGITGLWRPAAQEGRNGPDPLQLATVGDSIYTFVQNGATLTGSVDAPAGGFGPGAGAGGGTIEDGKVQGDDVSFRVGTSTYTGTIKGNNIELKRTTPPRPGTRPPATPTGPQPVIGPPPDGSDPSLGMRGFAAPAPIMLRRAQR